MNQKRGMGRHLDLVVSAADGLGAGCPEHHVRFQQLLGAALHVQVDQPPAALGLTLRRLSRPLNG